MARIVPVLLLAACVLMVKFGYDAGSVGGLALMAIGGVAAFGALRMLLADIGSSRSAVLDDPAYLEHTMRRDAAMLGGYVAYDAYSDGGGYAGDMGGGGDFGGGGDAGGGGGS